VGVLLEGLWASFGGARFWEGEVVGVEVVVVEGLAPAVVEGDEGVGVGMGWEGVIFGVVSALTSLTGCLLR